MRLYPEIPAARTRTIAGDILVVALLVLFAWAGMKVHDTVVSLNSLSRGVQDAGNAVNGGFADAAGAVDAIPLVGGALSESLRSAGGATGGNVVKAGEASEEAVADTANVLGWVTFALPAITLLAFVVPLRIRQVLRMRGAARTLGQFADPERRRLLAMRAAFGMPWDDLRPYSQDPIGDLQAGRYDPLVRALYADAGLHPPAPTPAGVQDPG